MVDGKQRFPLRGIRRSAEGSPPCASPICSSSDRCVAIVINLLIVVGGIAGLARICQGAELPDVDASVVTVYHHLHRRGTGHPSIPRSPNFRRRATARIDANIARGGPTVHSIPFHSIHSIAQGRQRQPAGDAGPDQRPFVRRGSDRSGRASGGYRLTTGVRGREVGEWRPPSCAIRMAGQRRWRRAATVGDLSETACAGPMWNCPPGRLESSNRQLAVGR